jgi:hypothetical protein
MDYRLKHPFTCIVAGPTSCGKTSFVQSLLENVLSMVDPSPENVIWCHGEFQTSLTKLPPSVKLVEGLRLDAIDPQKRNLLIIDDLMTDIKNDKEMTNLFTKGSHHKNSSVILILQNLFYQTRELRTMSLNSHYMILFKNPRDVSQITHLAKQMYPGNVGFMQDAFRQATEVPYGYLFVDLKQSTSDQFRLRSCVLPYEQTIVFVPK